MSSSPVASPVHNTAQDNQTLILSIRDLGKTYQIYPRPLDRLKQTLWRGRRDFFTPVHALRDVTMDLPKGDALGVIGRNGSGKSTFLQLVAGTLTPTSGAITVAGSVAALLELGAGFNAEFTGRENAVMNGLINGLSGEEIQDRIEEIAAFADIGEFFERPVKTYSSGMYVRLAFAVAISVEPDLLLVDEALSVGDIAFQHKCVTRIKQMRDRGMSLLFVSHSTNSVTSVCDKALLLDHGRPLAYGPAVDVCDEYLRLVRVEMNAANQEEPRSPAAFKTLEHYPTRAAFKIDASLDVPKRFHRYGAGGARFRAAELLDSQDQPLLAADFDQPIRLRLSAEFSSSCATYSFSFLVRDALGVDILGTTTFDERIAIRPVRAGERLVCDFTFRNVLRAGTYAVCISIGSLTDPTNILEMDHIDAVCVFESRSSPARPIHYQVWTPSQIQVHEVIES